MSNLNKKEKMVKRWTGTEVIEQALRARSWKIITYLIIRGQYDRVYYGIDPGMYCIIKLNLNNKLA